MKLTRIQDLLAQRHCLVAYTCLRRYVSKKGWFGKSSHTTVRMPDTDPGQMAEFDFGRLGLLKAAESKGRHLVWGMMAVLGYSRHQYLWPLLGQQLPEVIVGFEATWAFWGGIPRYVALDNFPAAVVCTDPLNPRLTRGFLEYAQHRGFIADPAPGIRMITDWWKVRMAQSSGRTWDIRTFPSRLQLFLTNIISNI